MWKFAEVGKGWHIEELSAEETLILTPREVRTPQRIPSEPGTDSEKAEVPELSDPGAE